MDGFRNLQVNRKKDFTDLDDLNKMLGRLSLQVAQLLPLTGHDVGVLGGINASLISLLALVSNWSNAVDYTPQFEALTNVLVSLNSTTQQNGEVLVGMKAVLDDISKKVTPAVVTGATQVKMELTPETPMKE